MQSPISAPMLAATHDLPAIARLQYQACAADPGFSSIFPIPPTNAALAHLANQYETLTNENSDASIVIVKDTQHGDILSYAVYHFISTRSVTQVEEEMLNDVDPAAFPPGANIRLGQTLVKNSVRKKNEVVSECFGMGAPFVCKSTFSRHINRLLSQRADLAAVGTDPRYQKLGAASRLVEWVVERANKRNLPMYVEGTPSALKLYQKFGFREHDRLTLDLRPTKEGNFANSCLVRFQSTT